MGDQPDPLGELNPLMAEAVEAFVKQVAGAFDEIFLGPDGAEIMVGYMDGTLAFHISRDGVRILQDPP
jgi:hypothetical protein